MPSQLVFGESLCFQNLLKTASKYSATEWPVLIHGETGVGKELLARKIHEESMRSFGPMIAVNCGAMTPGLFESEMFGHERGAYTGATQSSTGLVRKAHGGTLFLDEIGELELPLQVKLLRFIESGEVRSVGAARTEYADVRIFAATHVDLDRAVSQGKFRQDLLERLSVLRLRVPPLRERKEDIPRIAQYWLRELNAIVDDAVFPALQSYSWPGNIRQLRNLLIRAAILSENKISISLMQRLILEEELRYAVSPASESFWKGSLAEIEKEVIVAKLKQCGGNRKQTAKELGIAKSTLHDKLKRWNTTSPIWYRSMAKH